MNELNIEKQYRDDNDQEVAEDAPNQEGQEAGEPAYLDELQRLAQLKDDGAETLCLHSICAICC